MRKIEIIALEGFPEIKPYDDLSKIILETAKKNNVQFEDFDILVIAHKIVSKSEGRIVDLENVRPSNEAYRLSHLTGKDPKLIEVILSESREVVKALKGHLIVENVQGIVCANAGVDKSNVGGGKRLVLLPKDPDYSAKIICENLMKLTGKKLALIISDTYGRMLREGQVDMAIGLYGIYPFKDYRGKSDMFGYTL
ncbi:MAG: coenzyme F420-0:L-glutamate ligase, partial [Nitrososphaeria archaeon]